MEVLLFTVFASILLAAGFVAFFVYTQKNPEADADRDSLLPLEEEHRDATSSGCQTQSPGKPLEP